MTTPTQGPRDELLAFVDDELTDGLVDDILDAVTRAAQERVWSLGPPEFIDGNDTEGIRTVGCVLPLHATHDLSSVRIPPDLDGASFEDTKALVAVLASVSLRRHVDIGFELNGDSVGWLQNGEPDASLRDGLIFAWRVRL